MGRIPGFGGVTGMGGVATGGVIGITFATVGVGVFGFGRRAEFEHAALPAAFERHAFAGVPADPASRRDRCG